MNLREMAIRQLCVLLFLTAAAPALADNDRAQAREHYLKGSRAFDLGAYDEAIAEYAAAYRIKDDPALLYNLGQANRLAGHAAEALRMYRVFLNKQPGAINRAEVEAKIAELQKLVDQQTRTRSMPPDQVAPISPPPAAETRAKPQERMEPAPSTPAPIAAATETGPSTHPGRSKKVAGLAVGAVGVAAVATGIAFGVLAKNASDDLSNLDRNMGAFDATRQHEGKTAQVVEGVMLGVGAAAVVTGVVVYVLGHREARAAKKAAASLLPVVGPRQAGAVVQVSF